MKVKLLVEDRDLAHLFLDAGNADPSATEMELKIAPGIHWNDITNEDITTWMSTDTTLTVKKRQDVWKDMDAIMVHETEWPIPTPIIVLDLAHYQDIIENVI